MQVVAAIKIVPDDQDIQVAADRSLDFSKARPVVSEYDLNALEAAVQLAAATGGSAIAVTAGAASIDDSKTKKNVLARGMEALVPDGRRRLRRHGRYATARARPHGGGPGRVGRRPCGRRARPTCTPSRPAPSWPRA